MFDSVRQDLRYAARTLMRAPGFTAVALLSIALGIGANTAIFSVVHGVILKALPFEDPDRIVRIDPGQVSSSEMLDRLIERNRAFSDVSGYSGTAFTLTGVEKPEEFRGARVETNYFTVLGVQPAIGRNFLPEEKRPGAEPVVIISSGLWQRRFGKDPEIIGRTVSLGGLPRTVIGVMPDGYRSIGRNWEVWVPMTFDPGNERYATSYFWRVIARLAPDVTMAQARDEVVRLMDQMHAENPDYYGAEMVQAVGVIPMHDDLVGRIQPTLLVLLGAVAAVLLVACTNVANMLLARAGTRGREIAVRTALGAGRGRLIRQLLTESTLLGVLGGCAGVLMAIWTESVLLGVLPTSVPRVAEIGIDLPEIVFAFVLALVAAIIFGLVPALRTTNPNLQSSLKSGSRGGANTVVRHRLNRTLIGAEVALSVILVVSGGLLLKSLWRMLQVDPGFDAQQVITMRLSPPADRYPDRTRRTAYYQEVIERVRAVPGVSAVGAINVLPMINRRMSVDYSTLDQPVAPGAVAPYASYRIVMPGYFQAMGIPLLGGRFLDSSDGAGTMQVGLINEAMARKVWPNRDPVGREIREPAGDEWFTVVGVVGNVPARRLSQPPEPEMYRPFAQENRTVSLSLSVRVPDGKTDSISGIQRAVRTVDADVPISQVSVMDQVIDRSLAGSRFFTFLLSGFAGLALALCAIGVYGVGSYTVSRLTGEIGIRMALGAAPDRMLRFVIGREMPPVGIGLAIGVVVALLSTRVLSSFLFEVSASDPTIFIGVSLFLVVVALLAIYIPARRAARVDPLTALRSE